MDGLRLVKSEEYDAVVTDMRLGGMSGMDFLKEIKKFNAGNHRGNYDGLWNA